MEPKDPTGLVGGLRTLSGPIESLEEAAKSFLEALNTAPLEEEEVRSHRAAIVKELAAVDRAVLRFLTTARLDE